MRHGCMGAPNFSESQEVQSVSVCWESYGVRIVGCKRCHPCWLRASGTSVNPQAHRDERVRLFADVWTWCRQAWPIAPTALFDARFDGTYGPSATLPIGIPFVWASWRSPLPQEWRSGSGCPSTVANARAGLAPRRKFWTHVNMGQMYRCARGLRWKITLLKWNKWAICKVVMTS
jgi:hypothetical protein